MDGDAGIERWELKGGGFKSRICPRKLITSESQRFIELYNHYSAGHLAIAGGSLEQPALYLEAMALIGTVLNDDA